MNSVNNGIPFVPENTIDPAAGLNESINVIDALLQVAVVSVNTNAPPGSPAEGARYIVGPSPTGAWAGQAGKLARFLNTAWTFFDARHVLNAADGLWYVRSALTWTSVAGVPSDGSITNAKLAGVPTQTIKGRSTAGTGDPEDLTASQARSVLSVREQLTADRTYYVRTDGNDSNNGLANTAGGAFLTIQRAVDAVSSVDTGIYDVTVKIADGAYNDNVILKTLTGSGECIIEGNLVAPSNVTIAPTSLGPDNSIFSTGGGLAGSTYRVRGFKISSSVAANHFRVRNGSLYWSEIETGTGSISFLADSGAYMAADGDWAISGDQNAHLRATSGGVVFVQGRTVTISGSVSFGSTGPFGFASASRVSTIILNAASFIGSATGRKFLVEANAVIDTQGSGLNYLPGDIAGLTKTGGQYL